jgi:hypothetical protein
MNVSRDIDRKMLMEMPKGELVELLLAQMRNLFAVDGLYFLGIEERHGTESATNIDGDVWRIMGKIEARRLKETLKVDGKDIPTMIGALMHSSWSLDSENKDVAVETDVAIFRNAACRVQQTRAKKGLSEFPCKRVRLGYLKSFAEEFNPNIEVKCNVCPPDEHPENLWCEWEFSYKKEQTR